MEFYAITLLAAAGLYINNRMNTSTAGSRPVAGGLGGAAPQAGGLGGAAPQALAGDRPSPDTLYASSRVDDVLRDEMRRAAARAQRARDPAATGVVERGGDAVRMPRMPRMMQQQQQSETVHSALLGLDVPLEQFRHNNMVPFYRGSSTRQPMEDRAFTSTLETFTGQFQERPMGKKGAVAALWQPVRQDIAPGSPDGVREAYLATMAPSRNRANETPDGQGPLVVGRPGVQGGATGDVYYDMRAAALPPSVDELRAQSKPKLTFGGRVQGPAGHIQGPGEATRLELPVQAERRFPSLATELSGVDGLLRTTGAVVAEQKRPDDFRDIRETNRMTTSDSHYVGAAGAVASSGGTTASDVNRRYSQYQTPFRSTLGAPSPGPAVSLGGAAGSALKADHGRAAILVYGNNRDDTQHAPAQYGNFAGAVKALIAPVQDLLRTTKKEESVDAPFAYGNFAGAVPKLTVYDASDVARTTLRQAFDEGGAAEGPLGNLTRQGPAAPSVYFDPEDGAARRTRAEALLGEAPAANLVGGRRAGAAFDPEDVARAARKETTLAEPQLGPLRGAVLAGRAHDPEDVARASRKETLLVEPQLGPLRGAVLAGLAYDPASVARATGRQTMPEPDTVRNVGGSAASAAGGYTTARYDARTTMRQLDDEAGGTAYGQAAGRSSLVGMGYAVAPDDLRDTQRQVQAALDYFGGGGQSGTAGPTSYDTYATAVVHGARDVTLRGRAPTDTSTKVAAGLEAVGLVEAHGSGGLGVDRRALSPLPGRASPALPTALVQPESDLRLGSVSAYRDPVEHGATDLSARRLDDEAVSASCQRAYNPYTMPTFYSAHPAGAGSQT